LAKFAGLILGAVFAAVAVRAADAPVPPFQAGDRVCFIGDSITHGGRYHLFIHLFYATRFPDRRWEFFNAGVSGDSASGAVRRFDWDIAPHKPTVATIMLGMNDVNRNLYGTGQTDAKIETQRQQCLDEHAANMKKLAELLKQAGCRIIFITPSIYDQTGPMVMPNNLGVNDALGKCGQGARQLAMEFGGTVVDFHGPMTELNAREQAKDPAFTIVGPDRVHPRGAGHLMMAYLFLKAQQMPSLVARMAVDAKAAVAAANVANCTISNVTGTLDGVAFECLEKALPFPVPADAAGVLKLIPFQADLNQELLVVVNLAPGSYEIVIDDQPVAIASAEELTTGVSLSDNPKTPMYKQALEVQKFENTRHGTLSGKLRSLAAARHFHAPKDADPNDYEAMKKALLDFTEKQKDKPNYAYFKGQTDIYVTWKPKEAELLADMDKAVDGIWQANKPKPHRFVIRKTSIAALPVAVSTAIPTSTVKP